MLCDDIISRIMLHRPNIMLHVDIIYRVCRGAKLCPLHINIYDTYSYTNLTKTVDLSKRVHSVEHCCRILLRVTDTVSCFDHREPICENGDYNFVMINPV